jgi:hypothetical protein
MPYIYISAFSGPPATVTVCDFATETICYTSPTQITNVGPFPYIINLPSPDFDLVAKISLSAQSDNGCLVIQSDTCSVLPTPTASPLPNCSYVIFGTNDNFVTSGTVDYLDCNMVQQTYTATTTGTFGLCLISASTSNEIDVIDDETYQCSYSDGEWFPPYIESPTPTPSNPPTPTPSSTGNLFLYEPFMYYYSFPNSNASRTVNVGFTVFSEYVGQTIYANVGGNTYPFVTTDSPVQTFTIPVTGTSGTLTISALTTTVGQITSIKELSGIAGSNAQTVSPFTASTQNHSKLVNALKVIDNCVMTGNTQYLSALTSTTQITMIGGGSTVTGDIANIPDNVKTVSFHGFCTIYGDVSNIPNSIEALDLRGYCTITGNTSSFAGKFVLSPTNKGGLLRLHGYSNITGLMSNLPNVQSIEINPVWPTGVNGTARPITNPIETNPTGSTINGNITFNSRNAYVNICGANTISGDVSSFSGYNLVNSTILTTSGGAPRTIKICGYNTLNGNVNNINRWPVLLTIIGNNTISGNITGIQIDSSVNSITSLAKFQITQLGNHSTTDSEVIQTIVSSGNTINGNILAINQWLSCDTLILGGLNSVIGDIGSLGGGTKVAFSTFYIGTQNISISLCTNSLISSAIFKRVLQSGGDYEGQFKIEIKNSTVGNGLPASQVNNLLQHLDTYNNANGSAEINLTNVGIGAPSGVGLTSKNNLLGRGYYVVTN